MRIRFHPSLGIYLFCIAFLSSFTDYLCMLLALLIHETSHYIVAKVVGEQLAEIEISPLGGIMRYKLGCVPSKGVKGVLVHCAGPVSNWMVLLASGMPAFQYITPSFMHSLLICNVSMLMVNLLPILPLDGGQIVFCLGYYFFPVADLVRFLSALGKLTGVIGILLSVYGLIRYQILNCSLLIISLYLIVSAEQTQRTLLAENVYSVVHERLLMPPRIRKLVRYQVPGDTSLIELLYLFKQDTAVSFVFSSNTEIYELSESAFCQALISMHSPTVAHAYARMIQRI